MNFGSLTFILVYFARTQIFVVRFCCFPFCFCFCVVCLLVMLVMEFRFFRVDLKQKKTEYKDDISYSLWNGFKSFTWAECLSVLTARITSTMSGEISPRTTYEPLNFGASLAANPSVALYNGCCHTMT